MNSTAIKPAQITVSYWYTRLVHLVVNQTLSYVSMYIYAYIYNIHISMYSVYGEGIDSSQLIAVSSQAEGDRFDPELEGYQERMGYIGNKPNWNH